MNPRVDPFEELADLFLTEPDGAPGVHAAGPGPKTIELVVAGSLPVRASLWLTPYVDALARETGQAALLRLDEQAPMLQVLRASADLAWRRWDDLAAAIADLAPVVQRWVIRPGLGDSPHGLVRAFVDRITILCGANEGAIVDAYQRAKSIVEAARQADVEPPVLGVAVLGADRHTAERVHANLERTTRRHLEIEMSLVACVHRMDAGIRTTDCLTFEAAARPSLEAVLGWIRGAAPAEAPPPSLAPAEVAPPTPDPALAVKLAPKPAVEVEPKQPARAREPGEAGAPVPLAGFLRDVAPLDVRCPGRERLELAVDPAGRFHVIAREEDMRDLHVVAAWARAHRELIERACPGHWIDPAGPTVLHVFTDEPASLADLHGSDLRLHVLAPVTVEGRQGWYAAPLNMGERGVRA